MISTCKFSHPAVLALLLAPVIVSLVVGHRAASPLANHARSPIATIEPNNPNAGQGDPDQR